MHYYQFHIGDHARASYHLTNEEDLAFRRLKDMYHETEMPIPLDTDSVARRLRLETQWVISVLKDFFFERDDGWHMAEIDAAIAAYRKNAAKNAENGRKGGRPKGKNEPSGNPVGYESHPTGNPKPLTINHKPIEEKVKKEKAEKPKAASDDAAKKRGKRLPDDWSPSQALWDWTFATHPNINAQLTLDKFCDYWTAKSGRDATKADWDGTWRNWVRNELEFAAKKPTAQRTGGGIADQLAAYDV